MADCVSVIQKLLESLRIEQENISSSNNEGTITDLITNIHEKYMNFNLKIQERENINAYILNVKTGILSSLKAFLLSKDFRSVKLECFKLLDNIIELSFHQVQEYGFDIQSVCSLYISHDVGADVKKASLITLSKILEACHGFQGEKKIQPKPLIETLFYQLSLGYKLTPKVKEEVLCLIGIIAHYYPEDFIPYQERVLCMFLQELRTQVNAKAKSVNFSTIAGCLQGLKEYLYNFPVLCSEDPEKSYFIFDVAREMAIYSVKFSTKTSSAIRAGLQMIAAHALQFSTFVFENSIEIYNKLMEWVLQKNRDMQKLGRDTVISVLKVTSGMIMSEFMNQKNYCMKVFQFYMESFREIFVSNSSSKELHIAVIGYGLFAGPCKLCLHESDVKRMLHNIIQKSEHEFFRENENFSDNIMVLPCYIESLASIVSNIEFIPENTLFAIEKLVIFQIDKFPKVPTTYNFVVPKAIIHILVSLQPKGEIFVEFLSEIVYQGLVKTCSHPVVVEAENLKDKISSKDENESLFNQYGKESDTKIVTYKDYLDLWKNILNVIQLKELSSLGIPLQDRQYLRECIYDQLIRSSLELISKLDLTLQPTKQDNKKDEFDDENSVSSDPLHGIHPNNITDYYIFLNIVDFFGDLLIDSCTELFPKWVYMYGREMVSYATLYPYHSGFYKLISLNLSICNQIEYFKDISVCGKNSSINSSENVVWISFQLFSKFVSEVVVRLQQFKNELLASCLHVLLVLPIEIVLQEIDILIPALETALKLGMSYLPLATNAMCALEKWSDFVPLDKLQPHFPRLLPYLNSYILASSSYDSCAIPIAKQSKASRKIHKMSTKSVKKHKNTLDAVIDDPALQKIQLQILKFLGRLGKNNSALLENAFENMDKVAIAWDPVNRNHLKYAIPFVDMKPEIYFDDFLPRVLEVATKSSVRQVKVAACEALHSLVLFMVGRGSQMPEDFKEKFSMEALYKFIFPGLLELSCDVEQVAKQLFQPLVFQLIHWFTHNKVVGSSESSVILLALWDGVTHKENASLRDFSALCLKEYFQWFLKQAPQGKEKFVEVLLNKLSSFSLHPSPFKRIGAALTFNNIYKIFKQEEDLVKKYTIQLLVQFIDSLAIAHNDDKSFGTQKLCLTALEHVERIVSAKCTYFSKPSKHSKIPGCLNDTSLNSVIKWLLLQCGSIQTECRHKCMDLVLKLSRLNSSITDPVSILMDYNMDGKNMFDDIFERALRNKSDFKDLSSFKALSFWLEALLASLECYHWAFSDRLLLQNVLDGNNHAQLLSSVKIFNIMKYFITSVAKETLSTVTNASTMSSLSVYTPEEELKYNRLKCSVIVRLMSFIVSVFKDNAKWFHQKFFEIMWNSDLWEILVLCTVHPSSVGFDVSDPEVFENLPKEISFLLETLHEREDFRKYCCIFLDSQDYFLPKKLPLTLKTAKEDPIRLIQLFTGYELLISHGLWSPKDSLNTTEEEFINNLLISVSSISATKDCLTNEKIVSSPVVFTVAEKMLSLTYALGLKEKDLAIRLLNRKELLESYNLPKHAETLVFTNFTKSICEFVSRNPKTFIKTIVDNLNHTSFTEISILLKFIDYVSRTKALRRNYGREVNEAFLLYWNEICLWSEKHPDSDSMYSVLSIMQKMLLIDSEVAFNTSGKFCTSLYFTYLTLLKREGITLEFIVQAFNILPFFLNSEKLDLRDCLQEIIAMHFPLQSTELKPGSTSYHNYISALKKMLTALYLTGCDFLLEILAILVCKESSHVIEEDFTKAIIRMVKRTEQSDQQKFAAYIFKMILNDKCSLNSDGLLAILEKVLIPLLKICGISSFINFYKSHLKKIMELMEGVYSTSTVDIKVVKRIYGFKLLELLYGTLSKDLLHSKDSELVEIYLGSRPQVGNELSSKITKLCSEFKTTSYEKESQEYRELYRKLNCARFNTVMAIISCTQTEVKFYHTFLFREAPVKNELIWERIIDKEKCVKFDLEVDAPLNRQKQFVIIRHRMRDNSEGQENDDKEVPSSLQLLGSENLGLSSLAEDASKFVFSTEDQVFTREKQELLPENNENMFGYIKKQDHSDITTIELEEDDLNKHECMAAISCVFKRMKEIGIIPSEHNIDSAPGWLNFFVQSLENSNLHSNIKLFIGRLIINNATILQPYAKFLLKPMIKLITSGVAGIELNYYILDVIITLLSWAPSFVPGENIAYETCELLRFLIEHCDHTRREIFKNNMEVVKTILECWKDVLEIPYDAIYEKMADSNADNKKNVFGIQLLGIVILCNFPPYDVREEARGLSYLSVLLRNLNHKYKEVYGSAAEVISLILKYFETHIQHLKNESIEKNPFFIKVVNHLDSLKVQGSESKFLYCLNKIHLGCPKVADKYISKLLFLYPSIHGVYKDYILEVLCSRVDSIPNAFKEFKAIGIFENMEKRSESGQFLSLQVLEKLIPSLTCDDILYILPDIVDIHTQPSVQCRLSLFKILFVLFETYTNNAGAKEKEITRYAQETLIAGLADPDQSVRLTVDNFWSNEKRLPSGTKERLIALLKNLYSPTTEESFLQYATFLLLERTSNSPDYKRKVFDHPLTSCNFQTYQIQVSWRKRHVAMSPIFTETVSNSLSTSFMPGESFDISKSFGGDENLVKATQQGYNFPETVDPTIKSGTYNWLTEKSVDTFAFQGSSGDSFLGSFSASAGKSYLIGFKGSSKPPLKEGKAAADAKKKEDKKQDRSLVWMLKRRFQKDKGDSDSFAKQELRRQDRRKEILKEQQSQREAQVVMYRQYRIGELPDIEISNSSIIAPIQALAMTDVVVARLLFKSLVIAVCNYVKEDCPEEYEALTSEISTCFGNILSSSYARTPSVISFCLESLNQLQDVHFDAENVFVASIGSNQQSIGILLLESKILKGFDFQPTAKRKRSDRPTITKERSFWMKLAELYRSLNDYDVVNGIFSYTMGQRTENKRALQLEASGHYFNAFELYSKLYDEASDEFDQAEKDFWDKSMLACLDKLTKWENLETIVIQRFTDPESPDLQRFWEDQYIKDNYLPYWVRSKIKQLLEGKKDQTLLDFFDAAKKDEENKTYLENHAEDFALLYILQDRFDIARQFSSNCLNKFLKNWQNLSPLAVGMQSSNLQNLLKYVELDEFLHLMKKDNFLDINSTVCTLEKWQKRYPSSTDPVNIWDDMCSNRHLYLRKLQEKLENKTQQRQNKPTLSSQDSLDLMETFEEEQPDFKKVALETSVLININFADNSAEQKNFPVALKKLKEIYKVSKSLDQKIWSRYIRSYCSINNKRCSYSDKKLDILLQSWKQLVELENKCGNTVHIKNLQSQTLELVGEMFIKKEARMSSLSNDHSGAILGLCGSPDQIIPMILDKSFLCLHEVIHFKNSTEDSFSTQSPISAHMQLANFCNKYLRKEEDSDFSLGDMPSFKKFPSILTECLLNALEHGVADAFLLFPRLLQIIEIYPSCLPLFKEKVSKMPCWLFIGWISQMVALLDKPEASAVHEIVEKIAISYPDAIIYAFNLSYGSYKFSDTSEGKINKVFVEKIKSILGKQTLITDFVAALEQLSVPAVIFKDYICDITQLVSSKASKQEISSVFMTMYNKLLNLDERDRNRRVPIGPVQKKFSQEYKKKVLDACGANGCKLYSANPVEQMTALKQLKELYGKAYETAKTLDVKNSKLKLLSPWLKDFQPWKYASQIEIPGQYKGRRKPLPEYHVKVSGFDEKVMVLSSITLPRRITIRGNDEKEYKFLVKAGEDLRQDARIQQMFSAMNEIYQNDIACAQRHLTLKTYKVIPLSNRLGLIEWVDHTIVLQNFIINGMSLDEKEEFGEKISMNLAKAKFLQWVKKFESYTHLYWNLYKEKSRNECVEKFQEIVNVVPPNLLMKCFLKLSSCPEAFVALRARFATSHAVLCISQWIIGIGDRHLGNFLVDISSGYEVGIDFGHAFGSATQFLPVPELMPFRLTPQFLQLLDPLKVKGIYEATMVHALSALQNKRELLLNMLDIFIKEPTLDWKVFARKQQLEWGQDLTDDNDWFPKQRITLARKKLEGVNPSYITREELELGHRSRDCFKNMESVCLGNKEYNVRARLSATGLSPEEQVDCLIDQATDPYLLCLTYLGWNSWI